MRGTTVRRPSDRELAELLADTLRRVDDAELAQPGTAPDWARLRAGMTRGRRRWPVAGRRMVVLGAAVAVALIGTGIAAGMPSERFRQHAPSSKDQQAYSALYELPVKGALKNNRAWISAVQARLASGAAAGTGSMAGYRPADPDQIRIEFAGDVVSTAWRWPRADGPTSPGLGRSRRPCSGGCRVRPAPARRRWCRR